MDNEPIAEKRLINEKPPGKKFSRRRFLKFAVPLSLQATGSALFLKREADRLHEERFGSQLEDNKAQEILGYNPKEHNFKAFLQAKPKNGKYIVHIGQFHKFDHLGTALQSNNNIDTQKIHEEIKEVSFVQRNIRSLLSAAKIETVYMEGVTTETLKELSSIVELKQDFFDPITPGPNQWNELLIQYDKARNGPTVKENVDLVPALNYSLYLNRERLLNEYSGPEGDRGQFKDSVYLIDDYANYYSVNAAVQMFIEGKLKIAPAETAEENREAINAVIDRETNKISDSEYIKEAFSDRERVAIELITKRERAEEGDSEFVYLIFGSDHNFSEAVENNQEGFGLIKFEPIIP